MPIRAERGEEVTLSAYLDVEGANRAAHRLECAAQDAKNAAARIEDAVAQLRALTEDGYGNNVSRLIELLTTQPTPPESKI
jgi:predicted deacetylase